MLKMVLFYEWMLKVILSEPQTALVEQLIVVFINKPCRVKTIGSNTPDFTL